MIEIYTMRFQQIFSEDLGKMNLTSDAHAVRYSSHFIGMKRLFLG